MPWPLLGSSKKAQKVLLVIDKTSSCSRKEVGSWDSLDGMGVAKITGYSLWFFDGTRTLEVSEDFCML